MRHYDVANRSRNRFTGQVNSCPTSCGRSALRPASAATTTTAATSGCRSPTFKTFSLGADYRQRTASVGAPATTYEHYTGLQQSRSASPGAGKRSRSGLDGGHDGNACTTSRIYATPPRIGRNTEARAVLRLQPRGGELLLRRRSRRTTAGALAAAERVQQAAAVPPRREAPPLEPPGGAPSRTSTSRSTSTTSRSIRPSSTASSSRARWSSAMSIVRTRRIRWCSASGISGRTHETVSPGGVMSKFTTARTLPSPRSCSLVGPGDAPRGSGHRTTQ